MDYDNQELNPDGSCYGDVLEECYRCRKFIWEGGIFCSKCKNVFCDECGLICNKCLKECCLECSGSPEESGNEEWLCKDCKNAHD